MGALNNLVSTSILLRARRAACVAVAVAILLVACGAETDGQAAASGCLLFFHLSD